MKQLFAIVTLFLTGLINFKADANGFTNSIKVAPSGHTVVEVTINGQFTQPFIIDTGANSVTIPRSLFKALNIPANEIRRVQEIGGNGTYEVQSFTLDSVAVGSASVKNLEGTVSDSPIYLPGFEGVDMGVLPNNFLREFLTELDLSSKEVTFHKRNANPSKLYPNQEFSKLPIEVKEGGFINLSIKVNGIALTSHFDTGAGNTLLVNWDAARQIGLKKGSKDMQLLGQGMGTDGQPFDIYGVSQATDLTLNSIPFDARLLVADMSVFELMGPGPRGNLGLGIFNERKLFIDYDSKRIYFSKHIG
jgi:predicted aspartyl protease